MNITLGTDPEVFFTDIGNDVYPAGLVFGDHYGTDMIEMPCGNLIPDGVALEFQPFPSLEPAEVVANLKLLLQQGLEMAALADKKLAIIPEMPFDLSWVERDPELGQFGCNPDKSAWGEECTPATIDASKHPWRYAGCHIHMGVVDDQDYFMQTGVIERVSQALDRTVGLAAMVLGNNQDARRRKVYGRPGIYRHQPWGMEYRTPSNVILRSPQVMEFIFKLTKKTVELSAEHRATMRAVIPDDIVIQVLQGDDMNLARELYRRMANVFCLDNLPYQDRQWERSWFGGREPDSPWDLSGIEERVNSTPEMTVVLERTPGSEMPEQTEMPEPYHDGTSWTTATTAVHANYIHTNR